MIRDWEWEKLELKDKIVKSIENEIKETEAKLQAHLAKIRQKAKTDKMHKKRDDEWVEYEARLAVINEIKEAKLAEEQAQVAEKEERRKQHAAEVKVVAEEYKAEWHAQGEQWAKEHAHLVAIEE